MDSNWMAKKERFPDIDLGFSDGILFASPQAVAGPPVRQIGPNRYFPGRMQTKPIAHLGPVDFAEIRTPPSGGQEAFYLSDIAKTIADCAGHVFCVQCQDGRWAKVRIVGHVAGPARGAIRVEWQDL